jgi:hypothetical protein
MKEVILVCVQITVLVLVHRLIQAGVVFAEG